MTIQEAVASVEDSSTVDSCTVFVSNIAYKVWAEELAGFLNKTLGHNAVFACRIYTENHNWKSRGTGLVQFETEDIAIKAVDLATKYRLKFQNNYLQMKFHSVNIVDRPQVRLNCRCLYLGCLMKPDVFQVFWSSESEVRFEMNYLKGKVAVCLDNIGSNVRYKLTWKITSLCISGSQGIAESSRDGFILLQAIHGPKIFKKTIGNGRKRPKEIYSDRYVYFRDKQGDEEKPWQRCTDFTKNKSIEQASCYYLKVLDSDRSLLQNVIDSLLADQVFQHSDGIFLENLPSDSASLVQSGHMNKLPMSLIFLINNLVQQRILCSVCLCGAFFHMLDPSITPLSYTQKALQKLLDTKEPCYNPVEWFANEVKCQKEAEIGQHGQLNHSANKESDKHLVSLYRLTITPTRIYFLGPEVEVSNRVLRHYKDIAENFIRVHFKDEDMEPLSSKELLVPVEQDSRTLVKTENTEIYYRFLQMLKDGIEIGSKRFEFLAFSASQLREHSVWMFASSTKEITADGIRAWMGDFMSIKNVASCAARLGQSFSASIKGPDVYQHEIQEIPDIERMHENVKYCFSDGIGKISLNFATEVAEKCGYVCEGQKAPSAFQIRYAGYKGVVAIDPSSSFKLSLRPSMRKFSSDLVSLDVLEWTRFLPCYLNRQVITLLSTLGIQDDVFEEIQKERISVIDKLLVSKDVAFETIQMSCAGNYHRVVIEMLLGGYIPGHEPFLTSMLQAFKAVQVRDICKKSRILLSEGRVLMGCLDETGILEYGQAYVRISTPNGNPVVIEGKVVVAKNPCLHPGDVRVLDAINLPNLKHMVDCIVFPQKGSRPHPNECSGSDLDGDLYFVTWDKRLIPLEMEKPMDYGPSHLIRLDHSPTLEEIQEYFVNYMKNDSLGKIANAHVVFADREPEKARAWQCKELAELASIAVDFPKTGVAAILPKCLRPHNYPDFMEKAKEKTYMSSRVLGKLYRAAKDYISKSYLEVVSNGLTEFYDKELLLEGIEPHIEEALKYKRIYNFKLISAMERFGVQSEAQMVAGFFYDYKRTMNNFSKNVEEKIQEVVCAIKHEARSNFDKMSFKHEELVIASAWYHVTYHPEYLGKDEPHVSSDGPLRSFPWVVCDKLMLIKRFNRLKGD